MVASSFIADVHARLPTMCGEQVRYSNSALAPSASLQQATRFNARQTGSSYTNLMRLPNSSSHKQNLASVPRPSQSQLKTSLSISSQVVPSVIPQVNSHRQDNKTINGARVVPIFKTKTVNSRFTNTVVLPHSKTQPPIVPRFKTTMQAGASSSQTLGKRPSSNYCTSSKSTVPAPKRLCTDKPSNTSTTNQHPSTLQGQNQGVTKPASQVPSGYNQTVPDMNASISRQLDNFDITMNTVSSDKHISTTQHGKMNIAISQDKAQGKRKQSATAGLTKGYDLTGVEADILKKVYTIAKHVQYAHMPDRCASITISYSHQKLYHLTMHVYVPAVSSLQYYIGTSVSVYTVDPPIVDPPR